MPAKNRDYRLTDALLREYRDAALLNSQALLGEAALLLAHKHYARAYFLAACCIEEAGKAVQAYEGLGRNLQDPAVAQRLKLQFEDHSQKVTAAFSPWLQSIPDLREQVMDFIMLMVDLKFGREASMYTDIHPERVIVTTPRQQVREKTATDSIRLAAMVLAYAKPYAERTEVKQMSRVQDSFFALRPAVFQKILSTSDFWKFYIARAEAGDLALEPAVTEYNSVYVSKGTQFAPSSEGPA